MDHTAKIFYMNIIFTFYYLYVYLCFPFICSLFNGAVSGSDSVVPVYVFLLF
jgi:hypothetical protein